MILQIEDLIIFIICYIIITHKTIKYLLDKKEKNIDDIYTKIIAFLMLLILIKNSYIFLLLVFTSTLMSIILFNTSDDKILKIKKINETLLPILLIKHFLNDKKEENEEFNEVEFRKFIKNEEKNSKKFLEKMEIEGDRFYIEEYETLRPFFRKPILEILLKSIDDLTGEKIKNRDERFENLKYTILGDFLFSIKTSDLVEVEDMLFTTSRNEYLNYIVVRCRINEYLNFNSFEYLEIHKKLLMGLWIDKLLEKIVVRTNRKKKWMSSVFYELKGKNQNIKKDVFIGVCKEKFVIKKIIDWDMCIGSYRSIWRVKRKKSKMFDFKIDYNGVEKAHEVCLEILLETYKNNKELIELEKREILKEHNCSTTDEYIKKTIEEIKSDANKIMILRIKWKNEKEFLKESKKYLESVKLLGDLQKLIGLEVFKKNIYNKKIYLPCFIDNRGRQYYGTILSPTFNKIIRHMYKFRENKKIEGLEESRYYKEIMNYKKCVDEFKLEGRNVYFFIVTTIEIGKFFIKKDGIYMIKTEEIIKKGIEKYKEKNLNVDIEEKIYLKKMYNIIEKLEKKMNIDINTIVFKDATASGLQNYGVLAGYKDDMLKYLNINNKDWCDTYQYIVEKFVKEEKFKKRKYWKSTIMTIPYNAVWYSCFIKFINEIRKDKIEYKEMTENEKNNLANIHKEFFNNVKTTIKKDFYIKKEEDIKFYEFKYFKKEVVSEKEIKINYRGKRDKYKEYFYINIEDEKSTKNGREANNMHYLDANVAKTLLMKHEILTIHDCFGMRLCELHLIMDEINKYYWEIIKKGRIERKEDEGTETYSIHIII